MKKNPISALAITYNERLNINEFIKNIYFCDEIIIVDSYSTDKTLEIAKFFPKVRIYQHLFKDFSSQRNYAIHLAKYKWILFLDADERINKDLKNEILKIINSPNSFNVYYVYRKLFFAGKALNYSGFQKDKVPILFKKNYCFYDTSIPVHEKLNYKGKFSFLKNKLNHYSYSSWEQYDKKLSKYANIQANKLFKKKIKPNFFHFILKPFFRFINHYLFKRGILDGWRGFFISYLYSYYVFKRYVFLWMKYRNIK